MHSQEQSKQQAKLKSMVLSFAPQDWIVLGYFAFLNLALLNARGAGVARQVLLMGLILCSFLLYGFPRVECPFGVGSNSHHS